MRQLDSKNYDVLVKIPGKNRVINWTNKSGKKYTSILYVDKSTGKVIAIYTKVYTDGGTHVGGGKIYFDVNEPKHSSYRVED